MKSSLAIVFLSAIVFPLFSQSRDCQSLEDCQKALEANRRSSLALYRMGELFFATGNYQRAANVFRESLSGDLDPQWITAWAHLSLGKIFDLTYQRDRALNEYRLVLKTGDNTRGALDEAAKYSESPYKRS